MFSSAHAHRDQCTNWLVAAVCALFVSMPAAASTLYSDMFVFGDSLSDTGNYEAIGFPVTSPPYAPGRFTNGPVWAEHLADGLGLTLAPSAAGGNNYAWGGATTSGQPGPFPPFDLSVQVAQHLAAHTVANADALYVLWGGGNDALAGAVSDTAANLGQLIQSLANAGAQHFLVLNLPEISAAFAQVNGELGGVLDALEATLPISLVRFDVNALFATIVGDALFNAGSTFGITNVLDPCYNGVSACANPDSHLFWDAIHPTARAHALIGTAALGAVSAVPLPTSVLLLGAALAVLASGRLKRR